MTTHLPQFISLPDEVAEQLTCRFYTTPLGDQSRADLFAHALALSKQLPDQAYALNLCENRYLFSVAYLAVMLRKQVSLLPPNQSPQSIKQLLSTYQPAYCITDNPANNPDGFVVSYKTLAYASEQFPLIDPERTVSISFTSGSTGKPKAIKKNWREFQRAAELALLQLNLLNQPLSLVSTVPPQHMYGLETSLFWPLFSSLSMDDSRPFFPEDIRRCLHACENPGLLISTPAHLQACVNTTTSWPALHSILSSTAPLSCRLAAQIEAQFMAPLQELFGSTETLSIASRRVHHSEQWQLYQGVTLYKHAGAFKLRGGHLPRPVALDDHFLLAEDGTFSIVGRSSDLVKIAGKRASLAELNNLLNTLEGIKEGIFFRDKHDRLSILIVSNLAKNTILTALKQTIDPVFLPRQILRASALPRTATGKLNNAEVEAIIQGVRHGRD